MHFNFKNYEKIILSAFAISALTLVSCNTDFERDVNNMTVSTGKADFSQNLYL